MEIEGYQTCAACGNKVLDYVAWQTGGVCFDPCFLNGKMARFREVELIQRATVVRAKRPPVTSPAKNRRRNHSKANDSIADLARLRACRRMRYLFPDVFDLLYADERHKAGLGQRVGRFKDRLSRAVETYTAFVAYHTAPTGATDGTTQIEE